jgi:hypothetical protein
MSDHFWRRGRPNTRIANDEHPKDEYEQRQQTDRLERAWIVTGNPDKTKIIKSVNTEINKTKIANLVLNGSGEQKNRSILSNRSTSHQAKITRLCGPRSFEGQVLNLNGDKKTA